MALSLCPDREQDNVHDKLYRIIRGWGSDVPERLRRLLDEEGGSQSQGRETKHADNESIVPPAATRSAAVECEPRARLRRTQAPHDNDPRTPLSCEINAEAVLTSSQRGTVEHQQSIVEDPRPPQVDSAKRSHQRRCRSCTARPAKNSGLCVECLANCFPDEPAMVCAAVQQIRKRADGKRCKGQKKRCQECKLNSVQSGCGNYCQRCFRVKCPVEYSTWQQNKEMCRECNSIPAQPRCGKYCVKCYSAKFPTEHAASLRNRQQLWNACR